MKKLFFFIPALLLSLLANAAVININTGTTDALRKALNSAASGDIIEMAAGTYVESPENWIAFTNKNVTVRAAEGAEVILQPQVSIRLKEGATAEFIGIKFDCGHLSDVNSYSDVIFPADATDGKNIILRNCEFYGWTQNNAIIYSASSNTLNSLIIDNCYFHDVTKSCVFLENTTNAIDVQISNSTFANITTVTGSYYAGVIDVRSTTGSLTVDHCTFYNVQAMSTSYAAIGKVGSGTTAVVSNCIFAMPTSTSDVRTIRDAVTANNCLVFNYSSDSGYGMQSDVTKNNCTIADPLFTNAATGDFSLAGNWVTMALSPARGAATDGSDLGDPRWYTAETLPSTDFASPYAFVGAKAKITGNLWYDSENDFLYYNDKSECGIATWKINATRAGTLSATLNMNAGTTTGHIFKVEIIDAEGNSIGEVAEPSQSSAAGDILIPGTLTLPAAGAYTVKLYNLQGWSSSKINSITLSYIGGAVQNMPGTTAIADAWFSAEGTRADGKIDFPNSTIQDGWVKWNVAFASAANYNVIVNIANANGHNYTVALYEDEDDESPIVLSEGSQKSTIGTLEMGSMEVPAGNYILKVTNAVQWSDAQLISVQFVYAGGGTIDIPGSIALSEAILSTRAYMDGDDLHFTDADHLGTISGEYAKWNINVAADGIFSFTANCNATNWSHLKISILDSDENELYTHQTEYSFNTATAVVTSEWFLEAGNYILKAENPADWSDGYLTSLSAAQVANILIVDENATDMAYINEKNGQSMKPLLKRSFRSGMFNTVCFPFNGVTAGELESIFGAGYVLLEMSSATLADNVLTLNFSNVDLSGATYGRPYLIKPTQDVVNPLFNSHTIYKSTSHLVANGANANFVGSFIKGTVPAGEDNLFLGANDLLYFSEAATTIKGMRAYFQIHDVPSGAPIRQARIVEQGNVVTALEFVNGEWQEIKSANGTIKTIENGQLILIRDGKRYNVMGVRF